MFTIASIHNLLIIERFQLEGTSGDHQVQPPAQIKAYKASYIYIYKNILVQVLSYV